MKRIYLIISLFVFAFCFLGCDRTKTTETSKEIVGETTYESFTIHFDSQGGSSISDLVFSSLTQITSIEFPSKVGYTFDGWYYDLNFTQPLTISTIELESRTVYAKWVPNQYTIIFEENGGSIVSNITQNYDTLIILPSNLTKQGYSFGGWYLDQNLSLEFTESKMPLNGVTLYAKWNPALVDVTVYYYTQDLTGGSFTLAQTSSLQAYTESMFEAPIIEIIGFSYEQSNQLNMSSGVVIADGSLTLNMYYSRNSYTINFETNATISIESITAPYQTIVNPVTNPIRPGYEFDGWFEDQNLTTPYVFSTIPADNITIYAKWNGVPSTIYFNTFTNETIPALTANTGETIILPVPIKEGYTFLGWYVNSNFQTIFSESLMPVGGATLYAKWEISTFELTFNTMGGSLISSVSYEYNEIINVPVNPTKDGYVFGGWYSDETLTNQYVFNLMPSSNLTVYAKWISNNNPYSILSQTTKAHDSQVEVEGIVYALHTLDYNGFYIFDETGYVFINASHENLNIGDLVHINGVLDIFGQIVSVVGVTNINKISSNNALPVSQNLDINDIANFSTNDLYQVYELQGVLSEKYGLYTVNDILQTKEFKLYHKSYISDLATYLNNNLNQVVNLKFALVYQDNQYQAVIIDIDLASLTSAEKLNIIEEILSNYINRKDYLPYEVLDLSNINTYNLGTFTYSIDSNYQTFFDTVTSSFQDTLQTVDVPFNIVVDIDEETFNLTINATLKPIMISNISEFINGTEGSYYQIQAIIVSINQDANVMILKDSTGFLYASWIENLQIGDMAIFTVRKDVSLGMIFLDSENESIVMNELLSHNNDLGLQPTYLDTTQVLNLNPDDSSIYGQYIEIRGFILMDEQFSILNDDYNLSIYAVGHGGFEKLFYYEYLEVIMRGFLYQNEMGQIVVYYEGIRSDIRLPNYTDQELVDILEKSFFYRFSNVNFTSFDSFKMMPYDPVLGGEITWTMDLATESVYDFYNHCFKYTDSTVNLSFTITIQVGTASKTIVYNPVLNPIEITSFTTIKDNDFYGNAYVKGYVLYWHPDFVVLIDESNNLLFVDISDLPVYQGDEVILYGNVGHAHEFGVNYLRTGYQEQSLIEILSRNNLITLAPVLMTVKEIINQNPLLNTSYTKLVEVSGKLVQIDDFTIVLETADGLIYIDYVDDYTYFELERMKDRFVVIKGYIYEYDSIYGFDDYIWSLKYVGVPGDLTLVEFTDLEKITYIENYIKDYYGIDFIGGNSFDMSTILSVFPEVSITFTEVEDTLNLLDLSSGYDVYISSVLTPTDVIIQANIQINSESMVFNFTIHVLPYTDPIITDISSILPDGTTHYLIEGQVIVSARVTSEYYAFLVEDSTGIILVLMKADEYTRYSHYYSGYITNTVRFYGQVMQIQGKKVMNIAEWNVESLLGTISQTFIETTISDIQNLDPFDSSIYGMPVELQGTLITEYTDRLTCYITDGYNKVQVYTQNYGWSDLANYQGYMITIKGFVYGVDETGNIAIMFSDFEYDGEESVMLFNYSDQEVADMALNLLLENVTSYNQLYYPGDYLYFPDLYSVLNSYYNINITYTILQGQTAVEDFGSYLFVNLITEDITLTISIEVTVGTAQATGSYSKLLNGFTINSLEDLFVTDPDLAEIGLDAQIIFSGFGYHYLLVNDQVYYLKSFVNAWISAGDMVKVVGKKVVIDGQSDYTYDIVIIQTGYGSAPVLTTIDTDISELYSNDYTINPIYRSCNKLYGVLGYDEYIGLYTLTFDNQMVYIRMNQGYESNDFLGKYLGEIVYLEALLPMEKIRNEFWLVDVFDANDIYLPTYTNIEHVDIVKAKFQSIMDFEIHSGDSLNNYLPEYDFLHKVSISYELTNPADSIYFDPLHGNVFNYLLEPTTITIQVNLDYYDGTYTDTCDLVVKILPRNNTSINEILYDQSNIIYQTSGIVVAINVDDYNRYNYIIIDDGTDRIIVKVDTYGSNMFDYDNVSINLGDEVLIIGERAYYDSNGFVPCIYMPTVIMTLSTNNPYNNTPLVMTLEEILALDYTDPTIYTVYIQISGTIEWNNSSYYPTYYLTDYDLYDSYNNDYYNIELFGDTYTDFNTMMNAYDDLDVVLTGYLIGFRYIYSYCDWYLFVDSITVQ